MGGGKNGCFHLSSQAAPPQDKAMDISPRVSFRDASDVGVSNSHPDRTVGADVLTPYSNNSAFESDDIVDRVAAGAGATAVAMFERLWAECIGDHAFFGSRNDRGARSVTGGYSSSNSSTSRNGSGLRTIITRGEGSCLTDVDGTSHTVK